MTAPIRIDTADIELWFPLKGVAFDFTGSTLTAVLRPINGGCPLAEVSSTAGSLTWATDDKGKRYIVLNIPAEDEGLNAYRACWDGKPVQIVGDVIRTVEGSTRTQSFCTIEFTLRPGSGSFVIDRLRGRTLQPILIQGREISAAVGRAVAIGPQGPPGRDGNDGDVTPEAEAARDAAQTAALTAGQQKDLAVAARQGAEAARNEAVGLTDEALAVIGNVANRDGGTVGTPSYKPTLLPHGTQAQITANPPASRIIVVNDTTERPEYLGKPLAYRSDTPPEATRAQAISKHREDIQGIIPLKLWDAVDWGSSVFKMTAAESWTPDDRGLAFNECAEAVRQNGYGIIELSEEGRWLTQGNVTGSNTLFRSPNGVPIQLPLPGEARRPGSGGSFIPMGNNNPIITSPAITLERDLDPIFDPVRRPDLLLFVTQPIKLGDTDIYVSKTHNDATPSADPVNKVLKAGRWIYISSDHERWSGADLQADFPRYKSEMVQIRHVDYLNNIIQIAEGARDDYAVGGSNLDVVYIKQFKPLLRNIGFQDLNFIGSGVDPRTVDDAGKTIVKNDTLYGLYTLGLHCIDGLLIERMKTRDLMCIALRLNRTVNTTISDCNFDGRPYDGNWMVGDPSIPNCISLAGTQRTLIKGCHARGFRHFVDADMVGFDGIVRDVVLDTNQTTDVANIYGAHMGSENVHVIACQTIGAWNSYYNRGKHNFLVGNDFDDVSDLALADREYPRSCVTLGYGPGNTQRPELVATTGRLHVVGNRFRSKGFGVLAYKDVESGLIANNDFEVRDGPVFGTYARRLHEIEFHGNKCKITGRTDEPAYHIHIRNLTTQTLCELDGLEVHNNAFVGGHEMFSIVGTCDPSRPAENIIFRSNTHKATSPDMPLQGPGVLRGGYFGRRVGIRRGEFLTPLARPEIDWEKPARNRYGRPPEQDFTVPDGANERIIGKGGPSSFEEPGAMFSAGDTFEDERAYGATTYLRWTAINDGNGTAGLITPGTTGTGLAGQTKLIVNQNGRSGQDLCRDRPVTIPAVAVGSTDLFTRIADVRAHTVTFTADIPTGNNLVVGAPVQIRNIRPDVGTFYKGTITARPDARTITLDIPIPSDARGTYLIFADALDPLPPPEAAPDRIMPRRDFQPVIASQSDTEITLRDPLIYDAVNTPIEWTKVRYRGVQAMSDAEPVVSEVTYQPEMNFLLNRYPSPAPSRAPGSRADYMNRLVRRLKVPAVGQTKAPWEYLVALWIPAGDRTDAAVFNWISSQFDLTPIGNPAPIITPNRYVSGDGVQSYYSTGINLTQLTAFDIPADGSALQVGIYPHSSALAGSTSLLGFGNNGTLLAFEKQNAVQISTQFGNQARETTRTKPTGLHTILTRFGRGGYSIDMNGRLVADKPASDTNAFTGISNQTLLIGRQATTYVNRPWMCAHVARPMPAATRRAFHAAVQEYLSYVTEGAL